MKYKTYLLIIRYKVTQYFATACKFKNDFKAHWIKNFFFFPGHFLWIRFEILQCFHDNEHHSVSPGLKNHSLLGWVVVNSLSMAAITNLSGPERQRDTGSGSSGLNKMDLSHRYLEQGNCSLDWTALTPVDHIL